MEYFNRVTQVTALCSWTGFSGHLGSRGPIAKTESLEIVSPNYSGKLQCSHEEGGAHPSSSELSLGEDGSSLWFSTSSTSAILTRSNRPESYSAGI